MDLLDEIIQSLLKRFSSRLELSLGLRILVVTVEVDFISARAEVSTRQLIQNRGEERLHE